MLIKENIWSLIFLTQGYSTFQYITVSQMVTPELCLLGRISMKSGLGVRNSLGVRTQSVR